METVSQSNQHNQVKNTQWVIVNVQRYVPFYIYFIDTLFWGVRNLSLIVPKTTNEIPVVAMYSLQINFPRQEESLPKKPLIPFVQCQLLVQKLAWCYHSQKPDQNFTSGRQRLYLVCSRSSTLLKKEFNLMRYIFIDLYVSCVLETRSQKSAFYQ